MRVLLFQLDGKIPNLALMRIAAHHKSLEDTVELRVAGNIPAITPRSGDAPDKVYASVLFRKTIPLAEEFVRLWPDAIIGGTGVDPARPTEVVPLTPVIQRRVTALEEYDIFTNECDYSLWPYYRQSIGFTQRGCRMNADKCPFCCVPQKEGKVRAVGTINEIWRGDPWPREVILLDNDFFGQPQWRARIKELQDGGFKVSFNQGINARCLTDEAAQAIASVNYRDDSMERRRIYTAWDSREDEERLFAGLNRLVKYGVKPDNIMVYVIIAYWSGETMQDCDYRRQRLRKFGARPYPMPYIRTKETIGFQRWVIGAYDKPSKKWPNGVSWQQWERANYRPEKLG